jgi:ribosome biogenesis ATPase
VAQMLTCMDDLSAPAGDAAAAEGGASEAAGDPGQQGPGPARVGRPHVVVIGATNRPDALDPALRRAGRYIHTYVCQGITRTHVSLTPPVLLATRLGSKDIDSFNNVGPALLVASCYGHLEATGCLFVVQVALIVR